MTQDLLCFIHFIACSWRAYQRHLIKYYLDITEAEGHRINYTIGYIEQSNYTIVNLNYTKYSY